LDLPTAEDRTVNKVAHNLRVPNGPQSVEEPSSPSPKCCKPLRPLTGSLPQGQPDKPDAVPLASASPVLAVDSSPPPLLPLPSKPIIGNREEAVLYNELVGTRQDHNDWMDTSCQVGRGYLHPFHVPGQ